MQLETILNRVQKHRSFIYGAVRLVEGWHGPGGGGATTNELTGTVLGLRAPGAGLRHVRYHIMAKMGKAIDEVRAKETKALAAKGYEPVLKHTRWLLRKRPENLTEKNRSRVWPSCSTICARSALTCSRRTSNSSGATGRPIGPGNSSTAGVSALCALDWNQ
jgi:hypothetical protein